MFFGSLFDFGPGNPPSVGVFGLHSVEVLVMDNHSGNSFFSFDSKLFLRYLFPLSQKWAEMLDSCLVV